MNNNAIEQFINAVKEPEYETNTTYSAVVSRVDSEGVVWVNLAGSEKETPTASTAADVKAGDVVTVQWRNNKLYIAGNYSDPSAGVIRVANVEAAANTAREAANNAIADAGRARDAAEQAEATAQSVEGIAQRAENAATNAIKGLAQVEDVVDTLNWIATHCQYEKTTDVTIVTGKAYYTVTATQVSTPTDADIVTYYELVSGAYVKTTDTSVVSGKTYYTVVGEPVANPVVADIGTYYELEITEAVSNYINTHVAVTAEGLWLVPDDTQGSNKVLIAVGGQGHTYEQAGTYIIDSSNNVLAQFLANGVRIGEANGGNVLVDSNSVELRDGARVLSSMSADGQGFKNDNDFDTFRIGSIDESTQQLSSIAIYDGSVPIYITVPWEIDYLYHIICYAEDRSERFTLAGGFATIVDKNVILLNEAATNTVKNANPPIKYLRPVYIARGKFPYCAIGSTVIEEAGAFSVSEGSETSAVGLMSHAEGEYTRALGRCAHTQNRGTIAKYNDQTVIGKYNDNQSDTAFEIGNGSYAHPSNALTVDWSGDVCLALDTTAASGTDHDLYAAITALGWQSDVIV